MTSTQTKLLPGGVTPPAGLAVGAVVGGGTFAAAPYFWKITFRTVTGETSGSNEATVSIVLNGSANLTWTVPPARTVAVRVYRGTVTNTENALIAELPGTAAAFTDTGTAGTAATPPAIGSFANVNLDTAQRALKTTTALAGLLPGQLHNALRAINQWHNNPGGNTSSEGQAQKAAAAVGIALQDV